MKSVMTKMPLLILMIFFNFTIISFSQKLTEPKLVGVWKKDFQDFQEFIFHRTEYLKFALDEDPKGKVFARICSKNKFPISFIESDGSSPQFPNTTTLLEIPIEKVFFVRSSKCLDRSEEYWFIPENKTIEYEEIIRADKIRFTRIIESNFDNYASKEARAEFDKNLTKFVEMMKADDKLQGFLIRGKKPNCLNGVVIFFIEIFPSFSAVFRNIGTTRTDRNDRFFIDINRA